VIWSTSTGWIEDHSRSAAKLSKLVALQLAGR
jgi:hypothetical protein